MDSLPSSSDFLNRKNNGVRISFLTSTNTQGLHSPGPPDFDGFSPHNWHQASSSEISTDNKCSHYTLHPKMEYLTNLH